MCEVPRFAPGNHLSAMVPTNAAKWIQCPVLTKTNVIAQTRFSQVATLISSMPHTHIEGRS